MHYLRILPIILLAFTVCGCLAAKQPEQPAWGGSEEWRLKSLEENFLNFKEGLRQQNDHIERNHNDTTARIEELQSKMADMDKTLSELKENQQKMLAASAEEEITAQPVTVTTTETVVMGGSSSSEEKPWMVVPGENTTPAPAQIKTPAPPAPAVQPAPAARPISLSGEQLYKEGVRLIMNDKPLEARSVLQQFLKDNPNADLAPNALYWIGETYYTEKSYAQSILKFKEVSRRFPKARKVPDAMLKIGLAYDRLGDRENAVFYLRTLVDDYPKSAPAGIGRKKLREIGG